MHLHHTQWDGVNGLVSRLRLSKKRNVQVSKGGANVLPLPEADAEAEVEAGDGCHHVLI